MDYGHSKLGRLVHSFHFVSAPLASFLIAWRRIKMGVKVLYPQERLVLWWYEKSGDTTKVEDLAVAFTAEEELGKKAKGMKFGLLLSSVGLIVSILVLLSLILK